VFVADGTETAVSSCSTPTPAPTSGIGEPRQQADDVAPFTRVYEGAAAAIQHGARHRVSNDGIVYVAIGSTTGFSPSASMENFSRKCSSSARRPRDSAPDSA
jgi:hypothetical protein